MAIRMVGVSCDRVRVSFRAYAYLLTAALEILVQHRWRY